MKGLKLDFEGIIVFINWRGELDQSWWVIAGACWNVAPAAYRDPQVHISCPGYSKLAGRHSTFSKFLLEGECFLQRSLQRLLMAAHIIVWKYNDFWSALTFCLGFLLWQSKCNNALVSRIQYEELSGMFSYTFFLPFLPLGYSEGESEHPEMGS